jgi:hypothetical protein
MASYSRLGVCRTKDTVQCMVRRVHNTSACKVSACNVPGRVNNSSRRLDYSGCKTYLTRLLAEATIASSMAFSLAVVVASTVLAAADLGTLAMLHSGLARGVLLVAAPTASGALMTA